MDVKSGDSCDIVRFCAFNREFLDKSYHWLTDPEIKRFTLAPDQISKADQEKWFLSLSDRRDYLIWGVEYKRKKIGAVGLKHIDYLTKTAEYFGYIGEKEYWGNGIGTRMMQFAIEEAKKRKIIILTLNVADDNLRAINLYKRFGFISVGGEWRLEI